jgi:hypothetical protein
VSHATDAASRSKLRTLPAALPAIALLSLSAGAGLLAACDSSNRAIVGDDPDAFSSRSWSSSRRGSRSADAPTGSCTCTATRASA